MPHAASGGDVKAAFAAKAAAQKAFADAAGAGARGEAANKYALALLIGAKDIYSRAPTVPLDEALKPKIQEAVSALKAIG